MSLPPTWWIVTRSRGGRRRIRFGDLLHILGHPLMERTHDWQRIGRGRTGELVGDAAPLASSIVARRSSRHVQHERVIKASLFGKPITEIPIKL